MKIVILKSENYSKSEVTNREAWKVFFFLLCENSVEF